MNENIKKVLPKVFLFGACIGVFAALLYFFVL